MFFTSENKINKTVQILSTVLLLASIATSGQALAVDNANVKSNLSRKLISKTKRKEAVANIATQKFKINFANYFLFKPVKVNDFMFGKDAVSLNLHKKVNSNLKLNFAIKPKGMGLRFIFIK